MVPPVNDFQSKEMVEAMEMKGPNPFMQHARHAGNSKQLLWSDQKAWLEFGNGNPPKDPHIERNVAMLTQEMVGIGYSGGVLRHGNFLEPNLAPSWASS